MPELPEVQVVVNGLKEVLIGHRVLGVDYDFPKGFPNSVADIKKFLIGARITDVYRRAKLVIIDLDSGYTLVIHLKMTGQLVYTKKLAGKDKASFGGGHPSKSLVGRLPDKTTRITFELDNQASLFFNDMRKFGWAKLVPTMTLKELDFIKKLGPDALTIQTTAFCRLMKRRNKSIKACLLDQTIIAGCGNIYADESLWLAQIHPLMPASKLSARRLTALHAHLQAVLKLSIANGATTNKNYVNAKGEQGKHQLFLNVYQRAGAPCQRCATDIQRIVVAARGTHLCLSCQKLKL